MKLEEVQRISWKLKISCLQLPLLALYVYITILDEAGAFPLLPVLTFANAVTWCMQAMLQALMAVFFTGNFQQYRQCMYKYNIEACLHKHCCRGKE